MNGPCLKSPSGRQVRRLIELALDEDLGRGDLTTEALGIEGVSARARIEAKEPLVVAGLDIVRLVYEQLDPGGIGFTPLCRDGKQVEEGFAVAELTGSFGVLLSGERTALNFLQRLSGIATHVRRFAEAVRGKNVRLTDTRKTAPGWRVLEKYAVRAGGAFNHRMGLDDGVLIKDNHIAACGGIGRAVELARKRIHHLVRIEVEAETLDQVAQALEAGADVIMLDNMEPGDIVKAAEIIGTAAAVEVSGRVDLEGLSRLCEADVDIISSGALTQSARAVDLNMHIVPL